MTTRAPSLLLLVLLGLALPAVPARADECETCHVEAAEAEESGVHGPHDVSCVDCHGGDPDSADKDVAHGIGTGFRGRLGRADHPAMCGRCHGDARAMHEAGLRSDSLALWETSVHGRAVLEGKNPDAATCVDCHFPTHGTPASSGPGSPLRPEVVHEVCQRCHGDADLMERSGREKDIPEKYARDVHGIAFLEKGSASAPACITCHPAHALVPSGVYDHADFCGTCHTEEARHFEEGPHGGAWTESGDIMTCAHCHSAHEVAPVGPSLFDEFCSRCHGPETRGRRVADQIKKEVVAAAEALDRLERATAGRTDALRSRLDEARTIAFGIGPRQHAVHLGLDDIQARAGTVATIARDVEAAVEGEMKARAAAAASRRRWVPVIWVVVLMNAALFALMRRAGAGRRGKGAPDDAGDGEDREPTGEGRA